MLSEAEAKADDDDDRNAEALHATGRQADNEAAEQETKKRNKK